MSIDLLNYINTSDYGEWKRVKIPMKSFLFIRQTLI